MTVKDEYLAADGANKFLLAHCEQTLAEFRKTVGEVVKGYRGASHSVNRCNAEYADLFQAVEALRARCDALEADRDAAHAAIGKLQEAMTNARKAFAELRKKDG